MALICYLGWIIVGPFWLFSWIITQLMNVFPDINVPQAFGTWIAIILSIIVIWGIFWGIFVGATEDFVTMLPRRIKKLMKNVFALFSGLFVLWLVKFLLTFETKCSYNALPGIPNLDVVKASITNVMTTINNFLMQDVVFKIFRFGVFPITFFIGLYVFMRSLSLFRKKWISFVLSLCISIMFSVNPFFVTVTTFFLSSVTRLAAISLIVVLIYKSWKLLYYYMRNQIHRKDMVVTITDHITFGFFFLVYYAIVGVLIGLLMLKNPLWGFGIGTAIGLVLFGLAYYKYFVKPFRDYKHLSIIRTEFEKEMKEMRDKARNAKTEFEREMYLKKIESMRLHRDDIEMALGNLREEITKIRLGLKRKDV